jgi:hypothetical protein
MSTLPEFAKREKWVRRVSRLDHKGRLLNVATRIQGPRIHDVNPNNGEAIISTAKKMRQEYALAAA